MTYDLIQLFSRILYPIMTRTYEIDGLTLSYILAHKVLNNLKNISQ